nr:MAG TPA: tail protein [Bacteriophage sp.]
MVNIYEYNETDFNHRGTPLRNFLKCEITEALNGVYELNFEYPLESDDSHLLENGKILQVDNYDGKQLFRILYLQKDLDTIKGYALHISYDLLGNFIEDIYIQGMNGTRALQEVLNRSTDQHNFVGVSNITKLRNSRLVRKNTLEAIMGDKDNSLLSRWGGELYRDNFRINWLEKIGNDKGVTIKYAKNLTGIEYKVDTSNLVTHFIPKGFDGLLLPEKYVISPLADKYKPIVKRKLLELEDVKSKKVSPTQEDAVDHEQALALLREKSKKAFELGADKPEITCTVAFIDLSQTEEYKNYAVLEKIYLGDTVGVQYKGINVLTRCVGYTYDCLQNRYIHVELGNTPQQNLLANAINNQQALITKIEEVERSNVEKAKEAIKDSLNDGLGSNIKYYSDRILIMDTNDEATAKVVWKFNSNGLSVSTTGVNGNFRLATTKDGKFFAEIITGLKINSEMIETGAIDFKHLSSTVFSKVREGLITKDGLSEFLVTNEGLRQKMTEIISEEFETKKPELKGKDGKIPAFNQLIGSHFPSLDSVLSINDTPLKLNLNDYNGHNSIEVDDKSTEGNLKGFAIPTSIRETVAGKHILMRIPIYVFPDSAHTSIRLAIFPLAYDLGFDLADVEKGKWVIKEFKLPFTKSEAWPFKSFIFGTFRGHFKIAEPYIAVDDTLTDKWLPAIEDMKANNLTASARIEGSYLNENLMNCKVYLDVYSNGEIVRASTIETPLKIEIKKLVASGYTASGEVTLDSNGLVQNINIPNGTKDGKPIEVVFEVTCGENKTVASARLNNTIDVELVNSTIKKFKTFESTLDKFESKISEVDSKRFKLAYTRENLCSETAAEKKGSDLYFNTKRPLEANKEYYILADVDNVPENQNTRIYGAKNNGDGKLLVGGLNIWKVSFEKAQTNVNIFPLGGETKVKNVQIYEVPETEEPKEDIILPWQNSGGYIDLKFKRKLKSGEVLTLTFDVEGTPTKRYGYYYGINGKYTSKPILSGKNSWTFRLHEDKESVQFTTRDSGVEGKLSNVKCVLENFAFGYKTEYNISEMESTVRQTKSEIEHAVRKDNFGTVLTQNAQYLRLAWNNISKFIQFENGGMSFYDGGNISQNKLTARITDRGYQFWRDGYELGAMGTNRYKLDVNKKGIQFDLEYDGWFMGWAYRESKNDDFYTWKWIYTSGSFADYESDSLNAGCNVNLRGHYLKKARINPNEISVDDSVTDTIQVALADGGSVTLRFKNGFVVV